MIVGIGVDVVDIPRFERTISRTPRLLERLFSPDERLLKPHSLAARYAAKEALIKALGGSDGLHWAEIEVTSEPSGRPLFSLTGSTAAIVAARGITALHLSMSHDAGLATAYVVAESSAAPPQAPVSPPQAPVSPPVAPVSPAEAPVSPPAAPVSPGPGDPAEAEDSGRGLGPNALPHPTAPPEEPA